MGMASCVGALHMIVTIVACRAQEDAQLFGPSVPDELRVPWALSTPALSKIAEDDSWVLSGTAQILTDDLHLPASRCTYSACSTVDLSCNKHSSSIGWNISFAGSLSPQIAQAAG